MLERVGTYLRLILKDWVGLLMHGEAHSTKDLHELSQWLDLVVEFHHLHYGHSGTLLVHGDLEALDVILTIN